MLKKWFATPERRPPAQRGLRRDRPHNPLAPILRDLVVGRAVVCRFEVGRDTPPPSPPSQSPCPSAHETQDTDDAASACSDLSTASEASLHAMGCTESTQQQAAPQPLPQPKETAFVDACGMSSHSNADSAVHPGAETGCSPLSPPECAPPEFVAEGCAQHNAQRPVLSQREIFAVEVAETDSRRDLRWAFRPKVLNIVLRRLPYTGAELVRFSLYRGCAEERESLVRAVMGTHYPAHRTLLRRLREAHTRSTLAQMVRGGVKFPQRGQSPLLETRRTDRLVGAFVGLVCGDCLGAPLEFKPVRYEWDPRDASVVHDMNHVSEKLGSRFNLKGGQWTDDTSMALCVADSLLERRGFDALDMKLRFALWWLTGYNNPFGSDTSRENKTSIGLGGNISHSFVEFLRDGYAYTRQGTRNTSGNGSIMRNAPIALYYHRDPQTAGTVAKLQSLTTHKGDEAAELCRLLTHIIIACSSHPSADPENVKRAILADLGVSFAAQVPSVQALCDSRMEGRQMDRDWNWKSAAYRYSPTRSAQQPGYIGSYAMDAMAMALNIVWRTTSFESALLRSANMCGDADTVSAVVGQIAGAIYGLQGVPRDYLTTIMQWDNGGDVLLRAWRLVKSGDSEDY